MTSQTFTTSSATPPTRGVVPDKPALEGLEVKWGKIWEDEQLYAFDATAVDSREQVFSIDTPPPTVSGHLHPGHVFSYTHTDTVARYQRMRGKKVFYPMVGTTTVFRLSVACRTTTACAVIPRCRTTPTSPRRANPTPSVRCQLAVATSSSCASS
ncbi:valyl-tRNA synthetase [Cutibacterium acnes JCM 18916]|nr:valyl-tRNA synthetase [Cutibacterium acnes JCM 18916]